MKIKLLLSLLFLFVFIAYTFSQDDIIVQTNDAKPSTYASYSKPKKPRFWIGPKFGSEFSGFPTSSATITETLKSEWQAGFLMQYGRVLYLQPEVYFCLNNRNFDAHLDPTASTAVKIPAMIGLRFLNLGLFSLHVMGGPQWTIPLEGSMYVKEMDYLVGAGIDVLGFITADIRYTYNTDRSPSENINDFDIKSTPLNLSVGFKFR